jgi:LmbE family N-acetylglucosaminyl deacetylase
MNIFSDEKLKVLVLAPHTDDAEFGCGGTISKLIEQGHDVYCAAFSACEQSVLPQFPKDILITEVKQASILLGIKEKNLFLFRYEVRTFNYRRQDILDDIIALKKEINPDVVFLPSINDLHQDHFTIANEGIRAFKTKTIFGYELVWNNLNFNTSTFFLLDEKHVQTKINAINCYKSQSHRAYASEDFIKSLARVRGIQIGEEYAECFEVVRLIYK